MTNEVFASLQIRNITQPLIDASGQDGIQNPLIVITCDVFHLSKAYECCVAVEHRITAVGTVHSSIGMAVNSPANTFLVWQSIVSWIHAGILQKHVHETETTLEIYTDDFCFIRSFEIGMTNSKQTHVGFWVGEYSYWIFMSKLMLCGIKRNLLSKQQGTLVLVTFVVWYVTSCGNTWSYEKNTVSDEITWDP